MTNRRITFENSVEYDLSSSDTGLRFLERYNLLDKIHQGSLSQVFIIQNKETGELFTLKSVDLGECSYDLDLMKKINHPNIVKTYETFVTSKYLYIRNEYVKGITLESFINKSGPLSEEVIMEIALQLCDILDYLHTMDSSPAIYRDLKPANIIINDMGEIKLIDLDSIRQFKEKAQKDTVYIGTEGFAPPEQFGFGQTDIRSDIYTFGTTLYYLLTSQHPTTDRLKLKSIREIRRDTSDSIGKIIEKCTMFHPDNRYQNINELQQELLGLTSDKFYIKLHYKLKRMYRKKAAVVLAGAFVVLIPIYFLFMTNEMNGQFSLFNLLPMMKMNSAKEQNTNSNRTDTIDENNPMVTQAENNDKTDSDTNDNDNKPLGIEIKEIDYEETVGAYQPVISLNKLGIVGDDVISIRFEKDQKVIPIQFDMKNSQLILINDRFPENLLEIYQEYELELTTSYTKYKVKFSPVPEELQGLNDLHIFYMPAQPDKGFYYPYYLMIPSKESILHNKGKKNYLLVEPYDMGQVSDDMKVHLNLALQNAQTNSASIAEDLGLPRLVPVFIRPESRFNGRDLYTHALSRYTIFLDKFKQFETWDIDVFDHLDRIDLQLIKMTEHAAEYLEKQGWDMEEQLFMWGVGASGDFVNRFTFLHPERVKAAFYQSLPTLSLSMIKDTKIPYPFGTSDYKEITGNDFNKEAYNRVAKLGFVLAEYNENPIYPDKFNSSQETEQILKLLPIQDYPVKWYILRDLYKKAGLNTQVNLYEDYSLIDQDSLSFFEANRESRMPVYSTTVDPDKAFTDIFWEGKEEISGRIKNEIIIQKATINEAFWTGTLPKTLSNSFIDFYTAGNAWNYNPSCFFISILEWDGSRDHRQMSDRVLMYGGDLILRAEGYPDVQAEITEGSMTCHGEGYVYYVELVNGDDLVSGVKYKIIDKTGNWNINKDVVIERPIK